MGGERKRIFGTTLLVLLAAAASAGEEGLSAAPFKVSVNPEVRTTYISLGKIMEDRPMQVTDIHVGYDTKLAGVFGARNWDVSSLTDRRPDHRHCLYHTEVGPYWDYDLKIADGWTLKSDFTLSWTLYRGFEPSSGNKTYRWYQADQSLENPYVTPFWRLRKCVNPIDFFYFKAGLRRKIPVWRELYVTPQVHFEGGSSGNNRRRLGKNIHGGRYPEGPASVSFRLETGWKFSDNFTAYAYVEQYDVIIEDGRDTIRASTTPWMHTDLTLGGVGLRMRF